MIRKRMNAADFGGWTKEFLRKKLYAGIKCDSGVCWEWVGSRMPHGYGRIGIKRKMHLAHRVSYELEYGAIPKGLFVCHRCDNPSCINPEHLFLGTPKENSQDMARKGRWTPRKMPRQRGSEKKNAKLNESIVREIKLRLRNGDTQRNIAADYGIKQSKVSKINVGLAWNHVEIAQ